jgi:hypothetical protein
MSDQLNSPLGDRLRTAESAAYQRGVDAERARLLARVRDYTGALNRAYQLTTAGSAIREMGKIRVEALSDLLEWLTTVEAVSVPSDTPATE